MNGASVIVPVTFNGALRASLALDTGATITVVSRRIAKQSSSEHARGKQGGNGRRRYYRAAGSIGISQGR